VVQKKKKEEADFTAGVSKSKPSRFNNGCV